MSETIEVGFVECAESQISREDLAKKLEETADKLRCGFIPIDFNTNCKAI